ncbi:MAG TPA: MaoC/PaaZ C-terminal domain-containing protein [Spirochaetota bacterium]|nr:MaoC/PaaZ C-terminal domain-containing protein [Spirochaetota bacterium]HNT12979.1 MaoC/PaaZ C-terminal domain-containing protein [Spirochaetota bacterium]
MNTLATLSHATLPSLAALLVKAIVAPKPGLGPGVSLQRVERSVTGVGVRGPALEAFTDLCGIRRSGLIPLPFFYVVAQRVQLSVLTDPAFPLGIAGLVQIDNTFRQFAPSPSDAVFDVRCCVGSDAVADAGRIVEIVDDFYRDGARVLECRSHYVHTNGTRASGKKQKPADPPLDGAILPMSLASNAGRRYARVSGDYNPIHLHALTARPFGFKRPIAHGVYLLARVVAALEESISFPVKELHVAYKRPVYLPSAVDLAYRVCDENGECRFEVRSGTERKAHLSGYFSSSLREAN